NGDQTIDLLGQGIDSIDVASASIAGTGFSIISIPSTFGKKGTFHIRFAPTDETEYNAALQVVLDSCGTSVSLPRHGSGGPRPTIAIRDTIIDFPSILVGDSSVNCI